MAEALTFLAEEVGRAVALIWSGVGIAVRLNYEVMSVIVTAMTRIVQLLFLLTQKTAQLFSILANDTLLFLGDIGSGVIAASNTLHSLVNGIVCAVGALGTSAVTACHHVYLLIGWFYGSIIDTFISLLSEIGNLLHLAKCGFVLFGSAVLFAISFIPNLICLLVTSSLELIVNAYMGSSLFVQNSIFICKHSIKSAFSSLWNYFSDIPIHAILGACLGIMLLVGLKYLLQYMMDNLILIPDVSAPSIVTNVRRRFLSWYVRIWQEANRLPQRENNTEEEILDDANDENGNDNNDNVPDRNLIREEPPVLPRVSSRPISSSAGAIPTEETGESAYVIRPLGRPPITRRQRALGLGNDVTEEEVTEVTQAIKLKKYEEPSSKVRNLQWAKQLYKELQDEREGKLCIICQDKLKSVILLPCRHLCLCDSCRSAVITRDNSCPICRKPILDSIRVYL